MDLVNKLGGSAQPATAKQHLITNEHGVTSMMSDAHLQRMKFDASVSKPFADKMKTYVIIEDVGDGSETEEPQAETKTSGKKGKKSETEEPQG